MASRKSIPHSRHTAMCGKITITKYGALNILNHFFVDSRCDSFCNAGASTMFVRKQTIGDNWINFVQACVNVVALSPDGACHEMSRLKSLQCCNNLLFFRDLQLQVSCEAESIINAFKPSASSANAKIVTEWSLLLKNISVILLKHRVSETNERSVLTCANSSLDLLRSSDPLAKLEPVFNAIAAVATCAYYSPALRSSIASAGAEVSFHAIILLLLRSHVVFYRKRWFEFSTSLATPNATRKLRRQLTRRR